MSTQFTLDMIKNAVEEKYGTTDFALTNGGVCKLRNPIRLSDTERDALDDLRKSRSDKEEGDTETSGDQIKFLEDMIRLLAEEDASAEQLFQALDHGLAELNTVLDFWMEAQKAGEA